MSRRLDPQDAALLVIKLDRIAMEAVFAPDSFGPVFGVTDDFPLEMAWPFAGGERDASAHKSHYIR